MKSIITVGLFFALITRHDVHADPSSVKTNQINFYLCVEGAPMCRIAANSEPDRKIAQRLQTYFYKLTGTVLPVVAPNAQGSNDMIKNEIQLRTSGDRPSFTYCFRVIFVRTPDGKLTSPPILPKATLLIDANGLPCGKAAVSNFVEKVFGPPLTAIDDPRYKWPKTPTLGIDADKLQMIEQTWREF